MNDSEMLNTTRGLAVCLTVAKVGVSRAPIGTTESARQDLRRRVMDDETQIGCLGKFSNPPFQKLSIPIHNLPADKGSCPRLSRARGNDFRSRQGLKMKNRRNSSTAATARS
jgi:hypothetical protein